MSRESDSDDELSAFVRRSVLPVPMPTPGHVERATSAMRRQAARRARRTRLLDAGVAAAALTASLLFYFTNMRQRAPAPPLGHDAEHILAESFSGLTQSEADSDEQTYEAFAP